MAISPSNRNTRLDEYLSFCPEIAGSAQYWFFRTSGGSFYEAFIKHNCIAIGYPVVSLATLQSLTFNDDNRKKLARQIRKNDPTNETPGLSASQLLTFVHKMRAGDFVIIPSYGSHELTIGVVTDKPPFEKPFRDKDFQLTGFDKRRGVRWLKRVKRNAVNPNLYQILFSHQTITNISKCSQWIDTLLFDFFKKGNDYHFVLEIKQSGNINARDLFSACSGLIGLGDEVASDIGLNADSGKIQTRINLNSLGSVEFIAASKWIFIVGIIVVGLVGGKVKIQSIGMDIGTDGLITAISKFLTANKNRALSDSVRAKLDALKVDSPDDIVKIIEKINKNKS